MFRNRMLGGVSWLPFYAPVDAGAGAGGDAGAAGAGADAAAGAAAAAAAATAGAGADKSGAQGTDKGAAGADKDAAAAAALASGQQRQQQQQTPTKISLPETWREELAGEDKALLNTLKRHASLNSVVDWLRKTQLKISAGELKEFKAAPENATPEQMTAWREEQGLPKEAAAYVKDIKLADGTVLGEADKPLIESFAARALESNMDQKTFNSVVDWWYQTQDQLQAQRQEADTDARIEAEQALIQKWGTDFKPNMNALKVFWQGYPAEVQAIVLGSRTADGRVLGDLPEVADFFANLSRELNPAATLLPAGKGTDVKAVGTRIAEIDGMMYLDGKPNPAYWSNQQLQQEYRDLIDAQAKLQQRAA
jgi:hypothetical protein